MTKLTLHDWILVKINFDWHAARVVVELDDLSLVRRALTAEGVRELRAPKANEWGPSIYVNEVWEIDAPAGMGRCLNIEMQSGDVIHITAHKFELLPT